MVTRDSIHVSVFEITIFCLNGCLTSTPRALINKIHLSKKNSGKDNVVLEGIK